MPAEGGERGPPSEGGERGGTADGEEDGVACQRRQGKGGAACWPLSAGGREDGRETREDGRKNASQFRGVRLRIEIEKVREG